MKPQNSFQEIPKSEESENMKKEVNKKSSYKLDRKCICGIVLTCVIIFYISLFFWFFQNETNNLGSDTPITARLMGGGSHKKTCDDTEYGCCKIFTGCKVVGERVEYKYLYISVNRITSHDNFMSNCPSLETLVNKYNRHYGNMSTNCGEYGCCPGVNLDCDNAIRKSITNGNNRETVNTFLNHKKYKNILIDKEDHEGSNCVHVSQINLIEAYEDYYPEKSEDWVAYIVGILCCICFICWLIDTA